MHLKNWLSSLKNRPEADFLRYKALVKQAINLNALEPVGIKGLASVVLPVFNGEKYLEQAICSVLTQDYKPFELIIVDDCSNDNSLRIAEKFAGSDSRVKLIRHSENKKLPAALNSGFAAASGEFYTWISHDNIMLPRFLSRMCAELKERVNIAMIYGNMKLIDDSGNIIRGKGWYELPPMSGRVMLPRTACALNCVANNTIGAAFLYRASAAKFIGEYSAARFGIEDYDYWMRMNEVFEVEHTSFDDPMYLYRFHCGSLTSRDAELKITQNRPQLMKFDSMRRARILEALKSEQCISDIRAVIRKTVRESI